ncbi:K(+)-transporting ATPase subunit C [Flavobacterium rhizosphaerae]|uniref:Potassium-transporting ATPase KdpC subunit n=1 Tax=Flavobacterium rhizosphaerae TaxID=3163298 RepID=A0ABW8Z121_9FLAO
MKTHIIPAIRLTLFCAVFFCGFYTLCILGIAQLTPNHGKGKVITANGKTYHVNVAQNFTEDNYFWSRPSAVDYNGAGSGGSNKGPSNPDYLAEVQARIDTFILKNPGIQRAAIPSEMVTASGSGLDPHISVAAAKIQVKRIAKARNIPEEKIRNVITENTEKPLLGILGTEKINVLKLNLALNNLQ